MEEGHVRGGLISGGGALKRGAYKWEGLVRGGLKEGVLYVGACKKGTYKQEGL